MEDVIYIDDDTILQNRRILEIPLASKNLTPMVRSNTIPKIKSITKELERLSSSETIQPFSQDSFDNQSSIDKYSQENMDAAVGRWYEEEGWEEEDIDYNEFWEDFHHLDEQVCLTQIF
jgi:hypothetical protein